MALPKGAMRPTGPEQKDAQPPSSDLSHRLVALPKEAMRPTGLEQEDAQPPQFKSRISNHSLVALPKEAMGPKRPRAKRCTTTLIQIEVVVGGIAKKGKEAKRPRAKRCTTTRMQMSCQFRCGHWRICDSAVGEDVSSNPVTHG